jgi:hypothetical protein
MGVWGSDLKTIKSPDWNEEATRKRGFFFYFMSSICRARLMAQFSRR